MVSWYDDGHVSGYDGPTGARLLTKYVLGSPGCVNLNGVTRSHHNLVQYTTYADGISAIAPINFNPGDVSAASGRRLTASMFVAEASAFSGTPTPTQVLASPGVKVYRAVNSTTTNGEISLVIPGPRPSALSPDTKYWVLVVPTSVASMSSTPSVANDQPVGTLDNIGRGVSLWTNRTSTAPTITSPTSGLSVGTGTTLTLSVAVGDLDAVGTADNAYRDLAGIEVQYSRKPTVDDPSPPWYPLPMVNNSSDAEDGWYIDGSTANHTGQASYTFWLNLTIPLKTGAQAPNTAHIPSGDWRLRARTFDYGHPYPNDVVPLGGSAPSYIDPNQMAAAGNASPWSDTISIYVAAQCPPPIPLSPTNNLAVIAGNPVTLSWRFRSTNTPPYHQVYRTVQIRPAGGAWTTLVDHVSSSSELNVTGYPLTAGVQYEWRVRVMDNGAPPETSEWSEIAQFWVVAAPQSGTSILPVDTIDGATLGCGRHRAFIYRRGGKRRVGEITNFSHLDWSRVRDDISTAEVHVVDWGPDEGTLLKYLQTWAYELVIYRENGYTSDRVWEGPITKLTYESDRVVISARDVMAYAYRRIIREKMSDAGSNGGDTVVSRATRVMQQAFAPDDPNILAYLTPFSPGDSAMQYRSTPAYSRTAFEEIDDMAANAGLDYVAVGRAVILWGTRNRIGTLPEFRDADLGNTPIVSEYGMQFANRYAVSDGNGIYGVADHLDESEEDETYGLVEMLSSTWASDSEVDTGTYTQQGIATMIESFTEYAERSIEDRYPPPVVVRVPDNTSVNPGAVISIQHLVPGVVIPLRSNSTLREVKANQKLDSVRVIEESGTETVSITLSPFNRDDAAVEGVEE